jgi:hypothetical protein
LIDAFDRRPAAHTHSLGLIHVFVSLSLSAIGYRAVARTLKILAPLLPKGLFPSANGGQFWVLRLGLYELLRAKTAARDWVWLIDHTIQTGNGKCFVVVGIRLSVWESRRTQALEQDADADFALEHQDLSVFAIERVDASNAEAVHQQLEQLSQDTGITPCCLLSDQGGDVRNGSELFCADRKTLVVHDIAHAAANAAKRQLSGDADWQRFLDDANRSKAQIRQTPLAFLLPPDLKAKARWMNLKPLIDWSRRVLSALEDPQATLDKAGVAVDRDVLERKMGWLRGHAAALGRWSTMLDASATILKYVRSFGYHRGAPEELRALLADFRDGPARGLADEVLQFVAVQSARAGDRRLPGSSEVLESLIGKGKQLMGRNKNGYTKTILALAAAAAEATGETLEAALRAVKVSDVLEWIEEHLGLSLAAQRQRALPNLSSGTKTG